MDVFGFFILLIFSTITIMFIVNYFISQRCFIKPMKKKYNIEQYKSVKEDKLTITIKKIIAGIFLICFVGYLATLIIYVYTYNKIIFSITIIIIMLFSIYRWNKYKKYELLEYIYHYSADIFDWDKIYELNIDEDLKRNCFAAHNINYDTYKDIYMRHKEIMK